MSKVILVGAGPGDPDLITLKAIKALKSADVILYDALANPELLTYSKAGCEKVYVGKKPGLHQYQQIFINDMIVDYAKKYPVVVRLKGGDPFVFGRGHEELEHARAHGLDVEVIPGISSALSVPAINEIPLTRRGVNESFWVVTGNTMDDHLSKDVKLAAESTASVVVMMGMRRLHEIVSIFSACRGLEEPVAIIQNGSLKNEKRIFGTLESILRQVEEKKLSAPAIILIGGVVRAAGKLDTEKVYQLLQS